MSMCCFASMSDHSIAFSIWWWRRGSNKEFPTPSHLPDTPRCFSWNMRRAESGWTLRSAGFRSIPTRSTVLAKRATCHTFRRSFATHLLESGFGIRTIQELLEHRDVETSMIDTHGLNREPEGVHSPLDGW
jgi:integrase